MADAATAATAAPPTAQPVRALLRRHPLGVPERTIEGGLRPPELEREQAEAGGDERQAGAGKDEERERRRPASRSRPRATAARTASLRCR